MTLLFILTRLAWAEPPALDPDGARSLSGARFDQGPLSVQVGSAIVFPVLQHEQTIGIGFIGNGELSLSFPDAADAWRFANLQVLVGGRPTDELRAIAHGEAPFTTTVSQGFVFGDPSVLGPWLSGEAAQAGEAPKTLRDRLEILAEATDLDVGAQEGVGADRWVFGDFLGDQRLWYVREDRAGEDQDRWLGLLRDAVRGRAGPDVLSTGRTAAGEVETHTVALGPWEEPARLDGPSTRFGLETTTAEVEVRASAPDAQGRVAVRLQANVELLAHEDRAFLDLELPRQADPTDAWGIDQVEVDGRAQALPEGAGAHVRVPVDAPIHTGETLRVRLSWHDRWELARGDVPDANLATEPTWVLPRIGGAPPEIRVRVGLPADSGLVAAVSGTTEREWEEDHHTWVQARLEGALGTPRVALGRWVSYAEAAVDGMPAVRAHLFPTERQALGGIPTFVRTVVDYNQRLLPALPWDELELIQLRDRSSGFTWTSSMGLITLQQMQAFDEGGYRTEHAHLEEEVMAHEIAHQWWGALVEPARAEDRWMSETLAQVYACLFIGAAFGQEACTERQADWRERWEKGPVPRRGVSLRDASGTEGWHDAAYVYGPYVMAHMLRGRLGDDAFLGGLDAFAMDRAGHPATVDRLETVLEARSGEDLTDFFAWWMVGGFVPRLELVVEGTEGTLTCDVPFGTLDVPVVAMTREGKLELSVQVVDGVGRFSLPSRPGKVLLDPRGQVLARSRKVSLR